MICKRDIFIGKVKSRYWKTTHKFGVRLPYSVEEALRLVAETNTSLRHDAIMKEMRPVFKLWDGSVEDAQHKLRKSATFLKVSDWCLLSVSFLQ